MGQLYKLDFPNGKSYVGITELSAQERFFGHTKAFRLKLKFPLYQEWRKYGEPKLTILAVVENKDLAETEIRAIKVFNTLAPNGYNVSEGGFRSPMHHTDSKRKVSEIMRKLWSNPDQAKKFSDGMRGNSNRKGKPNSKEHSLKVSAALKGKKFTESHKEALKLAWIERKRKGLGEPWNKRKG